MRQWAGVDLGSRVSALAVVGERGESLKALKFASNADGTKQLLRELRVWARQRRYRLPVAVEDPHSMIAAAIRSAGYPVIHVHPVALAGFRKRIASSGSKSDRGDAWALANIIRVEPTLHRPMPQNSEALRALQVLTRSHSDLRSEIRAVEHRLWRTLAAYYPAALATFTDLKNRDTMVALELAPTPSAGRRLTRTRLRAALRAAGRTRGATESADRIVAGLKNAQLRRSPGEEASYGQTMLVVREQLRLLLIQRERMETQVLAMANVLPEWSAVSSFPALGRVTGATVLAEIGDDPDRFSSARGLLALAGVAPVTKASGNSQSVVRRRAYNRRLGTALTTWTLPLIAHSALARSIYDERRQMGDRHNAACRRVLHRFLSGLYYCIRTGTLYDEADLQAGRALSAPHDQAGATAKKAGRSRYDPLCAYLKERSEGPIDLSFSEIEVILDAPLPHTAYDQSSWWYGRNPRFTSQARAWIGAELAIDSLNLTEQRVAFRPIQTSSVRPAHHGSTGTLRRHIEPRMNRPQSREGRAPPPRQGPDAEGD